MKVLLVKNLSSGVSAPQLKQVFELYGHCLIQINTQLGIALVQYANDDAFLKAKQYLDNSNLLGMNSNNVTMQLMEVAPQTLQAQQQNPQITANIPTNTLNQQQESMIGKISMQKEPSNSFQGANVGMNIERNGRNSPFQVNNVQSMNVIKNTNTYQPNQPMMMNENNSLKNVTNKIDNQSILKEKEIKPASSMVLEGTVQQQFNPDRLFDIQYLKSKVNPSPKISSLVQFYQSNKGASLQPKVKAYASYQEFALDMQTLPKVRENQPMNEQKYFPPNENLKDIDTLTIAELTAELKKAGVNISGPKQVLKYTLERVRNENFLPRS